MAKYNTTYKTTSPYPTSTYPAPLLPLDVELLISICSCQGDSGNEHLEMIPHLVSLLGGMGLEPLFDPKGNLYVTKGQADVYPCMVAHLDTVHDYEEGYGVAVSADGKVLYAYAIGDREPNLTMLSPATKQAGVGGDDRVGIAIAMQLLQHFEAFKIVFFLEEEIGCRGSREAYMPFFDDVSVVLQCDRQGSNEWVQTVAGTQVSSDAFIEKIKPLLTHHAYRTIQTGGITDVGALKSNGLPVCAANMGCGYYSPHSSSETIFLPAMENTLNLCYSVLQLLGHEKQPHVYVPYSYKSTTTSSSSTNRASTTYTAFYPKEHGWVQTEVVEEVVPKVGKPYTNKLWRWQKECPDGTVLGPAAYVDVEKIEKEYQAKLAAEEGKQKQEELKAKKAKIKEWVALDGTWRFNKQSKSWQKFLKETITGEELEWEVAVASTILDIPFAEGEFRAEFENDILNGILTIKEVYEYIQLQRAEELAEAHDRQFSLPFSTGSERETFGGGYDDEGRYLPTVIRPPVQEFGLETLPCPHCNSIDERFVEQEKQSFYCMDCGMHSYEPVDTYAQEVSEPAATDLKVTYRNEVAIYNPQTNSWD